MMLRAAEFLTAPNPNTINIPVPDNDDGWSYLEVESGFCDNINATPVVASVEDNGRKTNNKLHFKEPDNFKPNRNSKKKITDVDRNNHSVEKSKRPSWQNY